MVLGNIFSGVKTQLDNH